MKIKNTVLFFLFILAVLAYPAKALAADANLYFSPGSTTVDNACYPSFDIMLDTGGQDTTGVDVIINYDSSKLEAHDLTAGVLYSDYTTLDTATDGKVVVQARAEHDEVFRTTAGSAQVLATIVFRTIAYGTANIDFKYLGLGDTTDTNVVDTAGNDILGSDISNASATIEDGASCPSASATNTPTPTSGVGGSGATTATPTAYSAPSSGVVQNTFALLIGGTFLVMLAGAFVLLGK